jgi:excisionase family DNA binding protein
LRYHDDDVLTVADAAHLARRSVRTVRRAYLSGKLAAHRDGNGRGVSIRYGDLRAWLTAEVIAPAPAVTPSRVIARANVRGRTDTRVETGNTDLLTATLQQRRSRARASASPRLAGRPSGAGRS